MAEATFPPVCAVSTKQGISAEFAMRTQQQQRWFRRYLDGKLHEPTLTEYILERLRPGDTFVDVGAHLGWFSVLAAARGAEVIAFEMQTGLVSMIQENVTLNGYDDQVKVVPAGIGSDCGIVPYPRQSLASSKGVSVRSSEAALFAACLTLDAALSGVKPTLIKIDVEGFEGHVLEGAHETLTAHRPPLVIELHDKTERFGLSIPGVLDVLLEYDYDLELFDSHRAAGSSRSPLARTDFDSLQTDSVILAEGP